MGTDEGAGPPRPARTPPLPSRTPGIPRPRLPSRESGPPGPPLAPRGRVPGGDAPVLPVRTSRTRRSGRHSSPHQLSVPPEAPALVIAVPAAATQEHDQVAAAVAAGAGASCPGIPVTIGYLEGRQHHLSTVLARSHAQDRRPAVVVPLLAGPHGQADPVLAAIAARAGFTVVVAGHLGPHPLLAEAVHARLAEAGLTRSTRAGRVSVAAEADGIIVGAAGGEGAVRSASVVAVLLASRLAMPAVPGSLSDPGGLAEAFERLHDAGVTRMALAPCVVGPELAPGALEAMASAAGLACARPLGGHPALGKLAAMRYGAALDDPLLAGLAG